MILSEEDIGSFLNQSSKGNQLKWFKDDIWYKADYTGYEALSEYLISHLLLHSSLKHDEFVVYDLEKVFYKRSEYNCCSSVNFLHDDWQIITLERLYKTVKGQELTKTLVRIAEHEERLRFLVNQVEQITGINNFGRYISVLLTIDAVFLNEDRHLHNIAVLLDDRGKYHLCPIFDNGAGLLSDTTIDYPMNADIYEMIDDVKTKTICSNPLEQLDIAEKLYGYNLKFDYTEKDIIELLEPVVQYPDEIKNRVKTILLEQKRKFSYLF